MTTPKEKYERFRRAAPGGLIAFPEWDELEAKDRETMGAEVESDEGGGGMPDLDELEMTEEDLDPELDDEAKPKPTKPTRKKTPKPKQ